MRTLTKPQVICLLEMLAEIANSPSENYGSEQLYRLGFEGNDEFIIMSIINEIRATPNLKIIEFKHRRQQALLDRLGGFEQLRECIQAVW